MVVDDPTFDAVVNGSCFQGCGVDVQRLRCHFDARLFGDPFIPDEDEASLEAPNSEVALPPSSVSEEYDEIPSAPPSAAYSYESYGSVGEPSMEDYEVPASASGYDYAEYSTPEPSLEEYYSTPEPSLEEYYSTPEPSLEEFYSIPEPSLEEEEYSIPEPSLDDYSIPEVSLDDYSIPEPALEDDYIISEISVESYGAPEPALDDDIDGDNPYTVEIPIRRVDSSSSENQVYFGSWSDCSQHCSQRSDNATRERTVVCRNFFGIPLPPSECRLAGEFTVVEECEPVSCIGNFFYVLGEWQPCSQECAIFHPENDTMSIGTRERPMYCFHTNGTSAAVENCQPESLNLDFLTERCGERPCSPVRYRTSPWTECSCANSTRSRTVECVDSEGINVVEANCNALGSQPPSANQDCTPTNC
eukprot:g8013.t1